MERIYFKKQRSSGHPSSVVGEVDEIPVFTSDIGHWMKYLFSQWILDEIPVFTLE